MVAVTPRPAFGDRPAWVGSLADYEWLARWYGYTVNVLGADAWKGVGTVLLVVSMSGEPLTNEQITDFRDVVREWALVGTRIDVVSVG